eukprot:351834-Prymnesium_polylepis.2
MPPCNVASLAPSRMDVSSVLAAICVLAVESTGALHCWSVQVLSNAVWRVAVHRASVLPRKTHRWIRTESAAACAAPR